MGLFSLGDRVLLEKEVLLALEVPLVSQDATAPKDHPDLPEKRDLL